MFPLSDIQQSLFSVLKEGCEREMWAILWPAIWLSVLSLFFVLLQRLRNRLLRSVCFGKRHMLLLAVVSGGIAATLWLSVKD